MQERIKKIIKRSVAEISKLKVTEDDPENLRNLAKLVQKLTPSAREMRQDMVLLDLPRNERTDEFMTLIIGNTKRFKLFLDKVVNPVSICKLVNNHGEVLVDSFDEDSDFNEEKPISFKHQDALPLPPPVTDDDCVVCKKNEKSSVQITVVQSSRSMAPEKKINEVRLHSSL